MAEVQAGGIRSTPISRSNIWIYGSLGFPLALIGYPLGVWLPRAYSTDVGVDLTMIGLIIALAALFDAFTDPLIGYGSDRYRTRFGRRKTWLAAGVPLLALAFWMLLNPPIESGAAYLGFWYLFLRVGSTLVTIPYAAWGAEMSPDYHVRTQVSSAREKFVLMGLIGAALVPFAMEQMRQDSVPALEVLNTFGLLIVIILPVIAVLVLNRVPEPARLPGEGRVNIFRSLRLMWRNGMYRRVLLIEVLVTGGESFRNTLSLFFMQDVIGIRLAGTYYALYFAMGLAAIPVWDWIAKRLGKHRSLAVAMVVVSITNIWMFTLGHGDTTAFLLLFMVKGFCFGAFSYLPRAMLADVVDLDTARSGDNRAGSYFAGHGFMTKCAYSLGGVSLPLLALVGYSTAVGAEHTDLQLLWLGFLYAIVPTMSFVFAFWLTWTWPLTSDRHARLRGMLDRKALRMARKEEVSRGTLRP